MHDPVVRERRIEGAGLAGVGADGLDADAEDVAIDGEEPRRARVKAGTVRAVGAHVEERRGIGAPAPAGAQQHPRAGRNAAVLRFPLLDAGRRQQEVRILGDLALDVDHARRSGEARHRDGVARVVRQVLARNPVNRRVEVRAGVLAEAQRVPVPRRSLVVVARDDLNRHAWRRREDRRQADDRRRRPERLRQIDDDQPSSLQVLNELRQRHSSGTSETENDSRAARDR